jgi:hypothetical protein
MFRAIAVLPPSLRVSPRDAALPLFGNVEHYRSMTTYR